MPGSFVENPLYCFPDGSQRYDSQAAWAIVPIEAIRRGDVGCFDWVLVDLESGRTLLLPVWDASELHVKDSYLGPPFAIELPEHLYVGQERVKVYVLR